MAEDNKPTADQIQYALDLAKEKGKDYDKSKLQGMSGKEVSDAIDSMKDEPTKSSDKQVSFALDLIKEQGKSGPTKDKLEKMPAENVSKLIDKLKGSGKTANQIAKTIMEQMGGRRGMMMIGAKNLTSLPRGLAFSWPNRQRSKGNYVEITLTGRDDYDMEFFNWAMSQGKKPVKKYRGIYAEDLVPTFEKQTGWFLRMATGKTANPFLRSLDPEQERLAEELHVMAENDGASYQKKDAEGAVKKAQRELRQSKTRDLDFDLKKVDPAVVKSLKAKWAQSERDHRQNQRSATMKKEAVVQEAMKRAKADPEFRKKLVAAVQKKAALAPPGGGPVSKKEYDGFFKHLMEAAKIVSKWETQDKPGGYVANESLGAFMEKLKRDMKKHVK